LHLKDQTGKCSSLFVSHSKNLKLLKSVSRQSSRRLVFLQTGKAEPLNYHIIGPSFPLSGKKVSQRVITDLA